MDEARAGEIARAVGEWTRKSVDAHLQGDDGHFLFDAEARPMIRKRDPDDSMEVWTVIARLRFTSGAEQGRAQRVLQVLDASGTTVDLEATDGMALVSCDAAYARIEKSPDPSYPVVATLDVSVQVL